jgi:hypothetical protein
MEGVDSMIVDIELDLHYEQQRLYEINRKRDFPTSVTLRCRAIIPHPEINYVVTPIKLDNIHEWTFADNFELEIDYEYKIGVTPNDWRNDRAYGPHRMVCIITNWNGSWDILRFIKNKLLRMDPNDPTEYEDPNGSRIVVIYKAYSQNRLEEKKKFEKAAYIAQDLYHRNIVPALAWERIVNDPDLNQQIIPDPSREDVHEYWKKYRRGEVPFKRSMLLYLDH